MWYEFQSVVSIGQTLFCEINEQEALPVVSPLGQGLERAVVNISALTHIEKAEAEALRSVAHRANFRRCPRVPLPPARAGEGKSARQLELTVREWD